MRINIIDSKIFLDWENLKDPSVSMVDVYVEHRRNDCPYGRKPILFDMVLFLYIFPFLSQIIDSSIFVHPSWLVFRVSVSSRIFSLLF